MADKIATREAYGNALAELGEKYDIVVLDADLSEATKTGTFKKKYPVLISEWDYTNNYLICDPDKILKNYDKNVWWICNNSGSRYLMSPKRRVLLQKRKINACSYEKGYRRKKHYYFHL